MYEVHIPISWGVDGLEATHIVASYGSLELAWEFVKLWYEDHGSDDFLLVQLPEGEVDISRGHPSIWAAEPDHVMDTYMRYYNR